MGSCYVECRGFVCSLEVCSFRVSVHRDSFLGTGGVLGGTWVVRSRVTSPLLWVISIVILLITHS